MISGKGGINLRFMESYKRLEKLCAQIMGEEGRISAYIAEMENHPQGARYVYSWQEDLKRLKHYRWVRNKISHDTDCTEENMCHPEDAQWLDDFYSRILTQKDPLALYRQATQPRPKKKPVYAAPQKKTNNKATWDLYVALGLVVAGIAIVLYAIWAVLA